MPYIKHIPIHTGTYLRNSLKYIHNPGKASYITGINCPEDINAAANLFTLHNDFDFQESKRNRARIAHHYVQSFLPGNIDEIGAHRIGVELTKVIAPGYMCHVATHKDREHIHNHIFIFSVHPETGYKYRHNDDQYKFVQEQSDALCIERGIRIIENPKKRDLNNREYRAMERGGSWKDKLAWDIDDAIDSAVANNSGKEGFIDYLKAKDYYINWQNKNISIKLPDHKAIRVDTLAKTYGERYKKESIESRLNGESAIIEKGIADKVDKQLPKHMKYGDTLRFNEFDRYMEWCMKKDKEVAVEAIKREPPQLDFYQREEKEQEKKRESSREYPKVYSEGKVHNLKREKKGKKERSWRDVLALDIDDAIDNAVANNSGKEGFIHYLKDRGYIVKYQNKNISIKILGRKAVRVDTLAKTHGLQYTKESIESRLNGFNEDIYSIPIDTKDNTGKAEYIRAGSYRKVKFFRFANHLSSKNGKTKDEREIERELEELGRFLSKVIRKGCRVNTMEGRWKIKEEKKEIKREQAKEVKKGKER